MKIEYLFLFLILGIAGCSSPASFSEIEPANDVQAWTEFGPQSQLIARALTFSPTCPSIQLKKQTLSMKTRTEPNGGFPRVCEAVLPAGVQSAELLGRSLKLLNTEPKKIVVFGDTGCRIRIIPGKIEAIQDCSKAETWPFAKMAHVASQWNPDLVIHLGDYLYRESACPQGNKGCKDSPWGNGWEVWKADFFDPARVLLNAAPWIFVRGNHESCSRAADGWFRALDPSAFSSTCRDDTPSYFVQLGSLKMAILDSSSAIDREVSEPQVKMIENLLKQIEKSVPQVDWLLTHKPVWAGQHLETGKSQIYSQTLLAAVEKTSLFSSLQLLMAGHVHFFSVMNFVGGGPIQMTSGNGGTELVTVSGIFKEGDRIHKRVIQKNILVEKFGFLTLEALGEPQSWKVTERDVDGIPILSCVLKKKKLTCESID